MIISPLFAHTEADEYVNNLRGEYGSLVLGKEYVND